MHSSRLTAKAKTPECTPRHRHRRRAFPELHKQYRNDQKSYLTKGQVWLSPALSCAQIERCAAPSPERSCELKITASPQRSHSANGRWSLVEAWGAVDCYSMNIVYAAGKTVHGAVSPNPFVSDLCYVDRARWRECRGGLWDGAVG